MKKVFLKNSFIFSSVMVLILTMNLSCCSGDNFTALSDKKDETTEEEPDGDVDYPSMEYKSTVEIGGKYYGAYSFTEEVSVDVDSSKIKMTSEYVDNSFKVKSHSSDQATNDVRAKVEAQKTASSKYSRANVSDIKGSAYSKIKSLFLFVSKAETDGRTIKFNRPVPFLPSDSASISSFLKDLEDGVSFSYEYKDNKLYPSGVPISITISASEDDNDGVVVKFFSQTTGSMDSGHAAEFWANSVFPKTSTYYIDKDRKVKTMKSSSQLLMSQFGKGDSGYYAGENVSTQDVTTKLCKYKSKSKNKSYNCD